MKLKLFSRSSNNCGMILTPGFTINSFQPNIITVFVKSLVNIFL